ncbi:MAG: glycosyltransferase family 61 protein [Bacteroidia bacterium]|nr:glycosyltransferase family 61 protein [Bacteroidia bacterium]
MENEDSYLFSEALTHKYEEPSHSIFFNALWDCSRGSIIKSLKHKIFIHTALLLKRKKVKSVNSVIWATNEYSGNYFHWFNDVLPTLVYLRSVSVKLPLLIRRDIYDLHFVKSSLAILRWDCILFERQEILKFKQLIKPTLTAGEGNQNLKYFLQVRDSFLQHKKPLINGRRIFLKRKNINYRQLLPEEEVTALFRKKGFEIVEADNMSLQEQIQLFSNCTHFAAAHGAGLTNMIFMQKNSKVLEVRRDNDSHNNCYFAMANCLNFSYYYFLAKGASSTEISVQQDNFYVDLDSLEKLLTEFISEI